jgi:predicted O-methyltransferase YrrM
MGKTDAGVCLPNQWKMLDAQSAELEVLDFLKSLVTTIKLDMIVETGTLLGHSSMKMAEGLKQNGFGRLVTVEYDSVVFARASRNIEASGLTDWIEAYCDSSLDLEVKGAIDILYSDSDISIREQEVRKFLPQVRSGGFVLIHAASSSFHVVREAALRLEQEGLLSVLLLSTPRDLIAQKLEGRA